MSSWELTHASVTSVHEQFSSYIVPYKDNALDNAVDEQIPETRAPCYIRSDPHEKHSQPIADGADKRLEQEAFPAAVSLMLLRRGENKYS